MSAEQLTAFRKLVDENESVQEQLHAGAAEGEIDLPAVAKEHGFEVTADDLIGFANDEDAGGLELTDFELSQVSGGLACAAVPIAAAIAKKLVVVTGSNIGGTIIKQGPKKAFGC